MGKIIIEASSVAELIALALSMQGGTPATVVHVVSGEDDDDASGDTVTYAPGALDAAGLPWDERIHSNPASQTSKKLWRAKRKVDPALVTQVENELRARAAGVQQPVQMIQHQPMQVQQTQPVMQQQPVMQVQPQQVIQQQPMQVQQTQPVIMQQQPQQVIQQQPMQTQPQITDFGGFMQALSKSFTVAGADGQPLVNQNYMAQLAAHFGLTAITDLQNRPDLIPNVVAQVQADNRWVY